MYCGTSSGVYTQSIAVGNVSSVSVSSLQAGTNYFFAVADYNIAGVQSPFSNEVSYTVPTTTPTPTPTATPAHSATPTPTPTATPAPTPTPAGTPASGSALMVKPAPGSKFGSSTVTFQWTAGSATTYGLTLGSSPTGVDIYSSQTITTLSATVASIPTDGRTVYVTLYSKVNNSWVNNAYTYIALNSSASPTPTPTHTPTPTPTLPPSPTPIPTLSPTPTPTVTPHQP